MGIDEGQHPDHRDLRQHGGSHDEARQDRSHCGGRGPHCGERDVANKIGTYTVAILAKEHNIPFYVAAPISTVDLACPDGSQIPIEQRDAKEVTHIAGKQMVPDGVGVENPAFDVTPAKYVAAIITEKGVAKAPYGESLRRLAE